MKKSTIFFLLTALVTLSLTLYNKRKPNPSLALAANVLGATATRLGHSLKKAIALKGILSFAGVWLVSFLCNRIVE